MHRKIPCCVIVLILFLPLFSAAETVNIEKDVLEKILQRQNELKQKIEDLQLQLEGAPEKTVEGSNEQTAPPLADDVEYLKDEVEYMSDRLDKTEKKSILDKVQIGGEFRVRADWLDFDNMKGVDGVEKNRRIDELWSSRLRLNLRSEITENLIFNGRLSYLKYWGETNYDEAPWDTRHFMTPDPDGNLHIERAYIDWFIPDTPFSFTFGRLPTSDGPPYDLKNDTTRKSTWVQSNLDGEYDGIILNADLEKWTGLKNSIFRLTYSVFDQNYQQYKGLAIDKTKSIITNLEMPWPGIDDSLLWFAAYGIWDLTPLSIPDGNFPSDAGHIEGIHLYCQFNDILDTKFRWFGSFGYEWIHPCSEGTVLSPGNEIGILGDSLHGDLGDVRKGFMFHTGLRYTIPFELLKNPHIGLEYNYGSQYWVPTGSFGPGEFTNKTGVNGHACEIYYIQPVIEKNMFFRIGASYQKFDYYSPMYVFGSREGDDAKSDLSILNTYFLMDVRF